MKNSLTLILVLSLWLSLFSPAIAAVTMGKTNIGAQAGNDGTDELEGSTFTAPQSGTIADVQMYQAVTGTTATQWKAVIVNFPALTIVTNGISNATAVASGADKWVTATFATPPSVTSGNTYVIMMIANGVIQWKFDNDTGPSDQFDSTNLFGGPTNPTDAVTTANFAMSIYAEFAGSAPAAPVRQLMTRMRLMGRMLIK